MPEDGSASLVDRCKVVVKANTEYDVYDNYDKIVDDETTPKSKTKFRIDRVAEDLIIRLATIRVGSEIDWKRTVSIICDRLKRNMQLKPKTDDNQLPRIFTHGLTATVKDVQDAIIFYSTIDLSGYDLLGTPEGARLRRRLAIFLSLTPKCVVQINLSHTGLNRTHVIKLLPFMSGLPNLQELDLRGNRLTMNVFKYFIPFLGKSGDKFRTGFASLRWVYFNHNVDIHRLPSKFIAGLDRRWPRGEHRPTPREVSDGRATVCDLTRIEEQRKKLIERRRLMEEETKKINTSSRDEKRMRAFQKRLEWGVRRFEKENGFTPVRKMSKKSSKGSSQSAALKKQTKESSRSGSSNAQATEFSQPGEPNSRATGSSRSEASNAHATEFSRPGASNAHATEVSRPGASNSTATESSRPGASIANPTAVAPSHRDERNNSNNAAAIDGAVGIYNDAASTRRRSSTVRASAAPNQNNANNAQGRDSNDAAVVAQNAVYRDRGSHGDDSRSGGEFYERLAGADYEFYEGVRLLESDGEEYILYVFRPLNRHTTQQPGVNLTRIVRRH